MNSIAVSTGTETNQTHISFGSVNSEGVIDNNKYNRYNFTFRNSWDIVKDVLSMDMGLFYIKQNNQNSNGQGMYYNPLVPVYLFPPSDDMNKYVVYERYDADRNFKTQYWPYKNQGLGMQNPYWIINRNMFNTDRDRYIMSLSMKWNITNWLNIIGRARVDNAYTDFERKLYASTDGLFSKSQGNYMTQEDKNTATYLDFLVNIDKKFGENYHLLVNLGGSYYDEKYKSSTFEGNLLGVPNFFHPSNIPSTESGYSKQSLHTQTQSLYGKAELGYRNFLYADVTSRIDWFSTLVGTSKEYVFYPSVGLSVVLSEIIPLPKKVFSFWKIRGSYAQVGNPPSAYLPYATVVLENGNATSANFSPANHLKAEMTKAFEFGMDLRLFDNKLNLAATYYNSNTYNQLFKYELPPSTGYAFAYENAGKVNNWGIELSVNWRKEFTKDLYVDFRGNFTYTENKYVNLDEPVYPYVWKTSTGKPLSRTTGYIAQGLFSSQEEIDNSPTQNLGSTVKPGDIKYRDVNDGSDQVMISPYGTTPRIQYGLGMNVTYKKFDFGVFFNGSAKRTIMISGISPFGQSDYNVMQFIADDYWSESNPNPNAKYPRLGLTSSQTANNTVASTYWMRNGNFIRFKTLELGYKFKYGRVYLNGDNIAVFSPFKLWDPELSWNAYPLQRTFNIGVQLNF